MVIEIFSDVVCPWCFIGKHRLDSALAELQDPSIEVVWRPYQLYPQLPPEGVPRAAFMKARFGSAAEAGDVYQRVRAEAEAEGLNLDFEAIATAPNTLRAHRLLSWSEGSGRQHALAEELFRRYFTQGRDVGDVEELAAAASAVDLDGAAALDMLSGADETDKVMAELALARSAGISGVPCFVLDGRFAIPGAQPVDTMRQLIERAREKLPQA